jgi:hypothetical protein
VPAIRQARATALLVLLGCSLPTGAVAAPRSGIAGRVVEGPTCPVETIPPQPGCAPRPIAATLSIAPAAGTAPAERVHVPGDGRFKVSLPPGTYVLRALGPASSPFPRPPAPVRIRVRAGRYTDVTVSYDTGIR